MTHKERRRRRYRPRRVRVLVVGESPPVSGRSFYAANSGLYRALRAAFEHDRGDDSPAFLAADVGLPSSTGHRRPDDEANGARIWEGPEVKPRIV